MPGTMACTSIATTMSAAALVLKAGAPFLRIVMRRTARAESSLWPRGVASAQTATSAAMGTIGAVCSSHGEMSDMYTSMDECLAAHAVCNTTDMRQLQGQVSHAPTRCRVHGQCSIYDLLYHIYRGVPAAPRGSINAEGYVRSAGQ